MMKPRLYPLYALLIAPLIFLTGCGKKEGYEVRGGKVFFNRFQGDGLLGKWRDSEVADAQGFEILQPAGYAKNPTRVFFEGIPMDGADAGTFRLMAELGDLAKDARQVYWKGRVIEGADAVTFEATEMHGLCRDKSDYYLGPLPLHVRDMASFKVLSADAAGKADHIWAHDRHGYYVDTQVTPIADSASFELLLPCYARDARQAYFGSQVIAGADAATFQGIGGENGEFAKDAQQVYWRGQALTGSDPKTFELLEYRYAKDSKAVYFCYSGGIPPQVFAGADPGSFKTLGPSSDGFGYAKDAKQVYYGGNVIAGADATTFTLDKDREYSSDKNRRYHYGEPVAAP